MQVLGWPLEVSNAQRTGRPLDRTNIWRLVRKYATLAGIKRQISPHTLRHCFATHLMEKGIQTHTIKRMLGHKSIVTTAGYIHISQEFLSTVKSPLDTLYEDFQGSL